MSRAGRPGRLPPGAFPDDDAEPRRSPDGPPSGGADGGQHFGVQEIPPTPLDGSPPDEADGGPSTPPDAAAGPPQPAAAVLLPLLKPPSDLHARVMHRRSASAESAGSVASFQSAPEAGDAKRAAAAGSPGDDDAGAELEDYSSSTGSPIAGMLDVDAPAPLVSGAVPVEDAGVGIRRSASLSDGQLTDTPFHSFHSAGIAVSASAGNLAETASAKSDSGSPADFPDGAASSLPPRQRPPNISAIRPPRAPARLEGFPLHLFRRWVGYFLVVGFDLEMGQSVERVWPDDLVPANRDIGHRLTDAERKVISFASFPDSNSAAHLGDSVFTFRVRRSHPSLASPLPASPVARLPSGLISSAATVESPRPVSPGPGAEGEDEGLEDVDGCVFGYVFFRQMRDEGIKRGFFQKSLVVLSPHPYPGLFTRIVRLVGKKYFDMLQEGGHRGMPQAELQDRLDTALGKVAAEIARWPPPPDTQSYDAFAGTLYGQRTLGRNGSSRSREGRSSGSSEHLAALPLLSRAQTSTANIPLPFLGKLFNLCFPTVPTPQYFPPPAPALLVPEAQGPAPPDPARPCRLHDLMHLHLDQLWTIWELVLLCEPVLVQGDTPRAAGEAVWCLVEMASPLEYAGQWRPYFTVQDPEFRAMRGGSGPAGKGREHGAGLGWRGGILGTTNPVFGKVLGEAWGRNVMVVRRVPLAPRAATAPGGAAVPIAAVPEGGEKGTGGGHPISESERDRRDAEVRARKMQGEATAAADRLTEAVVNRQSPSATGRLAAFFKLRPRSPARAATHEPAAVQGPAVLGRHGHAHGGQHHTEVVQSFQTKHRPFLLKDKAVIKKVAEAAIRGQPSHVLNNILRRHFAELTTAFLAPLDQYFETLLDEATKRPAFAPDAQWTAKQLSMELPSLLEPPDVRPFGMDTFLAFVQAHPPSLPVGHSRPLAGLYQAFLRTPNFARWLRSKYRAVYGEWRHRYLAALCGFDAAEFCDRHDEVEVVELLLRLREELERFRGGPGAAPARSGGRTRHVVDDSDLHSFADLVPPTREQAARAYEQAGRVIERLPEGLRDSVEWHRQMAATF
ncbi:hypothetical protein DFJ74DRAFT_774844 [Hyaloraphidium curvatum]|nr:hypothetical protein DFJ74DRAFT_774844 [Hyaloraphidium curvatum]